MRFIRSARHPFTDTARKRAALVRRQKADRDALPLFAAEIAALEASIATRVTGARRRSHAHRRTGMHA